MNEKENILRDFYERAIKQEKPSDYELILQQHIEKTQYFENLVQTEAINKIFREVTVLLTEKARFYREIIEQYGLDTVFYDIENNFYLYKLEDSIFDHAIGSGLLDTTTEHSDIDSLSIHQFSRVLKSCSIHKRYYEYEKLFTSYNSIDNTHYAGSYLVRTFLEPESGWVDTYNKLISHLAAVKFKHHSLQIHNEEIYQEYEHWLRVPGKASLWWEHIKNHLYKYLSLLPDSDFNWSSNADSNDEYSKIRDEWFNFNTVYPTIESCGYSPKISAYVFQSLILGKNILDRKSTELISNDEKEFILKLKTGSLSLKEYQDAKKYIWTLFRKSTETPTQTYLLGEGYNFSHANKTGYVGPLGDKKLLKKFEKIIKKYENV